MLLDVAIGDCNIVYIGKNKEVAYAFRSRPRVTDLERTAFFECFLI